MRGGQDGIGAAAAPAETGGRSNSPSYPVRRFVISGSASARSLFVTCAGAGQPPVARYAGVVTAERRRIFAFSGVLRPRRGGPQPGALAEFAISQASVAAGQVRRLCYIPTAVGDKQDAIDYYTAYFESRDDVAFSFLRLFPQPNVPGVRAHLLGQDVILVEGGSVVNLVAVWQAHGLPRILRECWEAGIVLAGTSAGSICWHTGGPTDSYSDALDPFTGGLAFVPYSNGVHDDLDDQPRRAVFREQIASGVLPAGYATEDGVGLLYAGTDLLEAVTVLPGRRAWFVQPDGNGGYLEQAIVPRLVAGEGYGD